MSPALIDTGALVKSSQLHSPQNPNLVKGQTSSSLFSLNHSQFASKDRIAMNPSNANHGPSGFQKPLEINTNFQFSSPSLSKSGTDEATFNTADGLSRPRIAKAKKSQSSRLVRGSEAGNSVSGFNPFRSASDNVEGCGSAPRFLHSDEAWITRGENDACFPAFRANENLNVNFKYDKSGPDLLGGMRELHIGGRGDSVSASQKSSVIQGSLQSNIEAEMMKLNMKEPGEGSVNSRINIGSGHGDMFPSTSADELPNELRKLNIKDPDNPDGTCPLSGVNVFGSTKRNSDPVGCYVFGSTRKNNDPVASSIASSLPDMMKNLNVKDPVNSYCAKDMNVKNESISTFSTDSTGLSGGIANTVVVDEMGKLKSRSSSKESLGCAKAGYPTPERELRTEKVFNHDVEFGSSSEEFLHRANAGCSPSLREVQPEKLFNGDDKLQFHEESGPSSASYPSTSLNFQPLENMGAFSFTSRQGGFSMPHVEFRAIPKGNLFTGCNKNVEFGARREPVKDRQSGRKKGKHKEPASVQLWPQNDFLTKANNPQDSFEPSDGCSPMEVSPCQETPVNNQFVKETIMTEESMSLDKNHTSTEFQQALSETESIVDDNLVTATEHLNIGESEDTKPNEAGEQGSGCCSNNGTSMGISLERSSSAVETQSFVTASEDLDFNGESEADSGFKDDAQNSTDRSQYFSTASSGTTGGTSFTFAASSSTQGHTSAAIRQHKKKDSVRAGIDLWNIPRNAMLFDASAFLPSSPSPRGPVLLAPSRHHGEVTSPQRCRGIDAEVKEVEKTKLNVTPPSSAALAAKEACEKWRLRGNQAYENGDLEKAEDYYSQGLNCISRSETSRDSLRALMLCYSNRAATRISLGRIREALMDCKSATEIDPNFFRVQLRKANCYLALGDVREASSHFKDLVQSGTDICVDRKIVLEASDGLQKAQKVSECVNRSAELLRQKECSDAEAALEVVGEALMISPYSEKLLEKKAEALLMLRKYEEVIQLCEQTLGTAEKNFPLLETDGLSLNQDASALMKNYSFRVWRYHLMFKSYFYLGKLEEGLSYLDKQEELRTDKCKFGSNDLESSMPLLGIARELLRHKSAGNGAYLARRHAEAIEHYTAALLCNVESRPFAAICFCNRAAASQALGQIADAIADCSLAIALDGSYVKAVSRRASLFEMIRDYDQAANDLRRLVSILSKQVDEKGNRSGSSDKLTTLVAELRQARLRLSLMEEQARKEIPLDFYHILGVEASVTATDLRKAYRKAALKHHPDKACQFLVKVESVDDALWKEIGEDVHKDTERLFKMIGEAYAVLSEPVKRSQYEEDLKSCLSKSSGSCASRTRADTYNYGHERSGGGRNWQDTWPTYGKPQSRGFEPTKASRFP